jgi:hypothetical protein
MVGWITALKIIPWGDVIEAAPVLAKGARKFFAKTEQTTQETAATARTEVPAGADALELAKTRIHQLEQSLAQMAEQQKASAELIESLAAQNAQVVQVIDILRVRTRLLIGASTLSIAAWVAIVIWLAR